MNAPMEWFAHADVVSYRRCVGHTGRRSLFRIARPLFSVCVLAALIVACGSHSAAKLPIAVRIEQVTTNHRTATSRYSGTALALTQVDLAFRMGGYVETLATMPGADPKKKPRPLQAGDRVSRDMVLAALRRKDFTQRYAEVASMNAEASAGYTKAKADYGRAKHLFDQGVITQSELEGARARLDSFAGSVGSASARAGQASLALSDSELRSPLDGSCSSAASSSSSMERRVSAR